MNRNETDACESVLEESGHDLFDIEMIFNNESGLIPSLGGCSCCCTCAASHTTETENK